jgi:hypothetical protein
MWCGWERREMYTEFQFENLKGRGSFGDLGRVSRILKYTLNKEVWSEIASNGSVI